MEYIHISHTFEPVYDEHSSVLILGTFPSVKSRENQFYYGHPQNRFWKVIAAVVKEDVPSTTDDKKSLLLRHGIAVWDVIKSCSITGSSDSSIRDVIPNDLTRILKTADIRRIGANGVKAYDLYRRYMGGQTQPDIVKLPSTSPANAACSLERLIAEYGAFIRGEQVNGK
jgi:hypoxanthine-DNA glycosylase